MSPDVSRLNDPVKARTEGALLALLSLHISLIGAESRSAMSQIRRSSVDCCSEWARPSEALVVCLAHKTVCILLRYCLAVGVCGCVRGYRGMSRHAINQRLAVPSAS